MTAIASLGAAEIAKAVSNGSLSAVEVTRALLDRIETFDHRVGAFTTITPDRALAKAKAIDAAKARGETLGPLAGAPFAVKNLYDIKDVVTRAGSKINLDNPPAARDATLIERMEAAGAVCLGALNMGEYAYDFTGENCHDGPSRNPHDLAHMSGGSSGGSGSAVAAGFAPIALASDTNGSIRVPSSLCGAFGLKPTFGRLSRARTFPFVASLDHLGPLARSAADLALAYDAMQGPDADDPASAEKPLEAVSQSLGRGVDGLRIGIAGGYFAENGNPEAFAAVERAAKALGATRIVEFPEAKRARAAAFLITTTEGAALHLDRLRTRAADFDPAVRDRLMAGAMIPAAFVAKAQKFRRWFQGEAQALFKTVDVVLAPATPCRAPVLGQTQMTIGGVTMAVRAHLGLYTQPISFIGLPVAAVPIWEETERLPIGVQIIGPAWREDRVLQVAAALETLGVARAPVATLS